MAVHVIKRESAKRQLFFGFNHRVNIPPTNAPGMIANRAHMKKIPTPNEPMPIWSERKFREMDVKELAVASANITAG